MAAPNNSPSGSRAPTAAGAPGFSGVLHIPRVIQNPHFSARTPAAGASAGGQMLVNPAPSPNSARGDINVSALNLITLMKRTSLIVYDADIFNCSQHLKSVGL